MKQSPVALVILDGFGYSIKKKYNAVAHAHMSYFNSWWKQYPHAILQAAGKAVGLPEGMVGNSQVGHLTIGSGRIIQQPMKMWLDSIDDGSFFHNKIVEEECEKLNTIRGSLHILGLLSDAGVHGHEKQIYAVIEYAVRAGIKNIIVHPFVDGRDVSPQSAYEYMHRLSQITKQYTNGQVVIGSMHGRFYAMDRDNNWDRIEKSYRALTEKQEEAYESWEKVLERHYAKALTDEFIFPTQLSNKAIIHNGDGIIFCNIRPDRAREMTAAFVQPESVPFIVKPINVSFFITPVDYGNNLKTLVLFPWAKIVNTLKDILAMHNKTIFTIAETEKYAHVTYFFRGENEELLATETRHIVPSLDVENYALYPHMSAKEITDIVINSLRNNAHDFYLINYANADMIAHSGNFGATIQALEFLDKQLCILHEYIVKKMDGTLYIVGDHGNAEDMFDEVKGQPRTGHTSNPVPFLMLKNGQEGKMVNDLGLKELSDIAPFILENMAIEVPKEMKKKN